MKVCTDACLFGALLPTIEKGNALDIGAGTGLLSLMFAQKNSSCSIDSVELDEAACEQAAGNFHQSRWKNRLHIYQASIQAYTSNLQKQYDIIFCNPPFFENDLKSENTKRNLALHSTQLSLAQLITIAKNFLASKGLFCVLLPYSRNNYFEQLAKKEQLFLQKKIFIRQTPKHDFFRSVLFFGKNSISSTEEEITIKTGDGKYSLKFVQLLNDYYLYL
ncbi:tRNA1(Val) (adenine(37)-N6)-methyltransferase [Arachidicoccus sp.]|jgi:tRNA1Val (adenine37-N6)-methyltransferase|uniref:tRNA1(Val) (adenine(37)-N6)-methyltransferase n=1 Tax=Arachidicoccus sp. TaxID=1872624 RepID=UPI003D2614C0